MPCRSATLVLAALALAPAGAQLPDLGGMSGLLKGGGLPNVGATGAGNAAGLLSYCLKNQLLGQAGGSGATSALAQLADRPGVAGSKAFAAGSAGTVVTGPGQQLPIGGLGDQVKGKVCGLVLQHARALIGR